MTTYSDAQLAVIVAGTAQNLSATAVYILE